MTKLPIAASSYEASVNGLDTRERDQLEAVYGAGSGAEATVCPRICLWRSRMGCWLRRLLGDEQRHRHVPPARCLRLLRRPNEFPFLRRDQGPANMPPDGDDVQPVLLHQYGLLALVPLRASGMWVMRFLKAKSHGQPREPHRRNTRGEGQGRHTRVATIPGQRGVLGIGVMVQIPGAGFIKAD
jgi:hypothetical protein